jgi:putative ATP-dependent endonuclease of the OLD family
MRLAKVRIRTYRCLKDLEVSLDDYTALIGPNGSGKSSVLYALDWFLNGGALSEEDLHRIAGSPVSTDIDVAVTFADLDAEDRRVLESYGRGTLAYFRRTWSSVTGKEKMIGNSRQGPGFARLRGFPRVTELRSEYAALRVTYPALGETAVKDEILSELTRWEDDPANAALLEDVAEDDATHMFGFNGEHTLAKRVRLVLVPAATDIVSQVGGAGRGSALSDLVGNLMSDAVAAARASWEERFADQIQELSNEIKRGVTDSTAAQADRVNERLRDLVPNAKIEFTADAPSWSLKGDGSLNTEVVIDGMRNDVSRQGHGVQRAVMIAMLQALVPDQQEAEGHEIGADAVDRNAGSNEGAGHDAAPSLIVCIEEPEIYQHPVRARNFARVLSKLADRASTQVFIATHSPYFVMPEQFTALRCFALGNGATAISATTLDAVAAEAGAPEAQVTRAVEKELPRTFSEGFFADAVVLVEGDTDRVVYEVIADRTGQALDSAGIALLAMGGKENMHIPFVILRELGIPAYVVADCDALGATRRHSADKAKEEGADESHRKATESVLSWLPASEPVGVGAVPFAYGDPSLVASHFALLHDDLESELEKWPSFMASLTENGGSLRKKDVATYRAAAIEASIEDMPEIFGHLVSTMRGFKTMENDTPSAKPVEAA